MKLTVIIPVYRVEDTLNRCVESVLSQTVNDMEVILVDDGSPDNCPDMCDEWASRDSRIRVIHKTNGGLSDARNAGLDIATGDFVTFVDSDDYLSPDTYAPLMEKAATCDILEFSIANRLQLQERCYDDVNQYWLDTQAYAHTYAWNKIYRRTLFDNIRYPKGKIFEDVYTLPLLLRQTQRVITTNHGFYHYTTNQQGITATADGRGLAMLLEAHLTSDMPIDDTYYLFLANIQMDVWELTGDTLVLPSRKVRLKNLSIRQIIKAILINILGIKQLCKLSKLLHKVKKPSQW